MAYRCCSFLRSKWPQVLLMLAATLGTVSDGIQYGWTSPAVPLLLAEDSPVPITESDAYWLESLYMMGGVFAVPLTVTMLDRVGRRLSIMMAGIVHCTGWLLIGLSINLPMLFVARFLAGCSANVTFVAAAMYIAEAADADIRGFLGSFVFIMMLVGVLIAYLIIPFMELHLSSAVGACLLLAQFVFMSLMPNSPYYSLMKGRRDKAKSSLQWLRQRKDVDIELMELEEAVKHQGSDQGSIKDLFCIPSNRLALIIASTMNGMQHMVAISVMLMNAQIILKEAKSIFSPEMAAIWFGVAMLLGAIGGSLIVDKFGRRPLLISSSLFSGLFLGVLGFYFCAKDVYHFNMEKFGIVPLLAVFGYAVSFKCGLGLVPLTAEIFPTNVKTMGMSFADVIYTTMAVVSLKLYYFTSDLWGMCVPFFVFSGCGILTAIFVYYVVPETKDKTLEEIQVMLKERAPILN